MRFALSTRSRETGILSSLSRAATTDLSGPLCSTRRDSGRNGHDVVYRAAPDEHPVISGSIRVQEWSLCDPALGIYQAYVGRRESRQLFVNGRRATRARTAPYPAGFRPAYFYFFGTPFPVGIEFIPTGLNPDQWRDPSRWTNPRDIEAVIVTQWRMMTVPLQSIIPYPEYTPNPLLEPGLKTGLITLREPGWTNANIYLSSLTWQPGLWSFWQVTRFENAYEFLDEPGEWYLNKSTGMLYYIPRPGEDLASADVELPILEALVEGRGEIGQPVSHIRFEGLTFSYATWLSPGSSNGYVSDQSGFHLIGPGHQPNIIGHDPDVVRTAGNVRFRFARNIGFHGNIFEHLGGAGLDFDTGSQGNTIADNLFTDISSAAIQLGGVSTIDHHPVHPEQVTQDNGYRTILSGRLAGSLLTPPESPSASPDARSSATIPSSMFPGQGLPWDGDGGSSIRACSRDCRAHAGVSGERSTRRLPTAGTRFSTICFRDFFRRSGTAAPFTQRGSRGPRCSTPC